MSEQGYLFKDEENEQAIAQQKWQWKNFIGWDGPEPGKPLSVDVCCPKCGGYWYMAPCIAIKQIDAEHWLCRVEYKPDAPAHCLENNGTELTLHITEIWGPRD